jgi:hypothetical protein
LRCRLFFLFEELGSLALELGCLPFEFCVAALDLRACVVALFFPVGGCFVVSCGRSVVRLRRSTVALC